MDLHQFAALAALLVLATGCQAYDNGVGLKPALGWNTWCTLSDCHNGDNLFFDRCNEWELKAIAQAMLDNGMHDLGFEYINLDDCWAATTRDADGNIQPDPDRFPSGMKAMADWLHARGLKFGLYTSMGDTTCNPGGRPTSIPGSFGHYKEDTATFAAWGMGYIKVDWCGNKFGYDSITLHSNFSHWLNATGRPMWLELCRGYDHPLIPPYVAQVAQSWRVTGDHQDNWNNTKGVLAAFMKPTNPGVPYAWNYGDFLMTGGPGCNSNNSDHCPMSTDTEYRSEFSVWAISSSPLIVATDIRNMTAVMQQCLLNAEAIGINQDYQSPSGKLIGFWHCDSTIPLSCPVYGRQLSDRTYAAVLLNLDDSKTHNITVPFEWLGMQAGARATVHDVLEKESLGESDGSFTKRLQPHESIFIRLYPQ
eukprot:m.65832 g.65832  ORF g.65832 m.65832 type:complete len:421 (-) comp14009_c0_seq1:350-1612(-)